MTQGGVPVVFDGVVTSTEEYVGDLGPAILDGLVQNVQDPVLFYRPVGFLEKGIELIVPALTALFA